MRKIRQVPLADLVQGFPNLTVGCGNSSKLLSSEEHLGIEIELEGMDSDGEFGDAMESLSGWNIVGDGSLRNHGIEFITYPVSGRYIEDNIDSMFYNIYSKTTEDNFSERTGIHIHINMFSESSAMLSSMLLLWLIVEPAFFRITHPSREHSPYVLPWGSMSYDTVQRVLKGIEGGDLSGTHKYHALNFASIREHGTVELRIPHSDITKDKLYLYINSLIWLKSTARQVASSGYGLLHGSQQATFKKYIKKTFPLFSELNTKDINTVLDCFNATYCMGLLPAPAKKLSGRTGSSPRLGDWQATMHSFDTIANTSTPPPDIVAFEGHRGAPVDLEYNTVEDFERVFTEELRRYRTPTPTVPPTTGDF